MKELLDEVAELLRASGSAIDAAAEAERIVRACGAVPSQARAMARRRAAGAPLGHVTGRETFMGIELLCDEGALAPRQETELLGNRALEALRGLASPRVIDMCCGAGNLACALAARLPGARVWASDLTDGCVSLARRNAAHVGVAERVSVAQGDLFAGLAGLGLEGSIDAVVCNPPYISRGKLEGESAALLKHEPREAFDGGPYGLSIHQRVLKEALPFLAPGAILLFEIGLGQDRQMKLLFERAKAYEDIALAADAAGQARVVSGRKRAVTQPA